MAIKSFTISNFRAFRSLSLDGLGRVNLIAGTNNAGKTALLEALYQFSRANQPYLGLRLNDLRGIQRTDPEDFALDLFHRYDGSTPICLAATGDWGPSSRSLQIELRQRDTFRIPIDEEDEGFEIEESPHEIVLNYTDEVDTYESTGWLDRRRGPVRHLHSRLSRGANTRRTRIPNLSPCYYFTPHRRIASAEDADRFSRMELQGRERSTIESLRSFEPSLSRLTIISISGSPVIHADVGLPRLIPIWLMGDGIQRFLSLALAFGDTTHGLMLVDEIENGIHYSRLSDFWRVISSLSKQFNTQVFATTHSEDNVRAAHEVFSEQGEYDFRYYRLDRVDGDIKIKSLSKVLLDTAFDANFEIR